MGTPGFALPALQVLREKSDLLLLVTQPDRPAGRGRHLKAPVAKVWAEQAGIEVVQPVGSVTRELGQRLTELAPDLIVVAAFGKILGRKILRLPRLGCINLHASLLPRHRGASPPAWAIMSGDEETGVTIQQVVSELDAGDVFARGSTTIEPNETSGELLERLGPIGAGLLAELLPQLEAGTAQAEPQDHSLATFAPPVSKEDGLIDWSRTAQQVHDHVRGMSPWPVAHTACGCAPMRIHETRVIQTEGVVAVPGEVIVAGRAGVQVACGQGVIEIRRAQRQGKGVVNGVDLVCGRLVRPCDRFGS
jgi:methionyl-tRNA formyltransferase